MATAERWQDLEDKGFLVVPGFFGATEVTALVEGFDQGRGAEDYAFNFKLVGRAALGVAWRRIEPVIADVCAATRLRVDTINFLTLSHYITTRFAERTSFLHQDFDLDYKLTGDHLNYLNFWIPLRKPDPAKSNVTLIPFDALRRIAPKEHARFVGSGGYRFVTRDGRTAVFGNYGDVLSNDAMPNPERLLDFDIEGIAVTPSLAAGDLLLMRGDVIHRTQDVETERVAASLRVTYSGKSISRERLDHSGAGGTTAAGHVHALIRKCFDSLGRQEITIADVMRFARGGGASH